MVTPLPRSWYGEFIPQRECEREYADIRVSLQYLRAGVREAPAQLQHPGSRAHGEWEQVAKAAAGVSDYAKQKFIQKAEQD